MTGQELNLRHHQLKRRTRGHGAKYIPADNSYVTKQFMAYFAEHGCHEMITKLPIGDKFTEIEGESPIVIGSLPFKNVADLGVHWSAWNGDMPLGEIEQRKAKSGVDLIYLGNIDIKTAAEHAAKHPDNPVWFLGKASKHCRVVPKVTPNTKGVSIGFDSYSVADKTGELIRSEKAPTLHFFDHSEGKFVDTGCQTLDMYHHIKKELGPGADELMMQQPDIAFGQAGHHVCQPSGHFDDLSVGELNGYSKKLAAVQNYLRQVGQHGHQPFLGAPQGLGGNLSEPGYDLSAFGSAEQSHPRQAGQHVRQPSFNPNQVLSRKDRRELFDPGLGSQLGEPELPNTSNQPAKPAWTGRKL